MRGLVHQDKNTNKMERLCIIITFRLLQVFLCFASADGLVFRFKFKIKTPQTAVYKFIPFFHMAFMYLSVIFCISVKHDARNKNIYDLLVGVSPVFKI